VAKFNKAKVGAVSVGGIALFSMLAAQTAFAAPPSSGSSPVDFSASTTCTNGSRTLGLTDAGGAPLTDLNATSGAADFNAAVDDLGYCNTPFSLDASMSNLYQVTTPAAGPSTPAVLNCSTTAGSFIPSGAVDLKPTADPLSENSISALLGAPQFLLSLSTNTLTSLLGATGLLLAPFLSDLGLTAGGTTTGTASGTLPAGDTPLTLTDLGFPSTLTSGLLNLSNPALTAPLLNTLPVTLSGAPTTASPFTSPDVAPTNCQSGFTDSGSAATATSVPVLGGTANGDGLLSSAGLLGALDSLTSATGNLFTGTQLAATTSILPTGAITGLLGSGISGLGLVETLLGKTPLQLTTALLGATTAVLQTTTTALGLSGLVDSGDYNAASGISVTTPAGTAPNAYEGTLVLTLVNTGS
jgi:hypothetical protein